MERSLAGRGIWRAVCASAIIVGVLSAPVAAHAGEAGKVRFVKEADTGFEAHVRSPSPAQAEWMRAHFWRQKTYEPFFDSRTAWYPNAWTYKDAYAIYVDGRDGVHASEHPEWVLRDAAGRPLHIPYGCSGGSCPQYAADIGNPAFRAQWIAAAKDTLAHGYRGLFVDDVNLELKVADGNGKEVAPIDPRTGQAMTLAVWRRTMADFVEQIRAAIPGVEIAHNPIWFSGHSDPSVRRQLLAADYVNLERGVNDDFHAGNGQFALTTFLEHIDWLHAHGKGVVLDSYANSRDAAEYNLAAYFLISTERDGMRTNYRNTPDDWWSAYDVDLGAPKGERTTAGGLLRRDFADGYVLVNLPGGAPRTLELPADARAADGTPRTSVTLPPASGRVVLTSTPQAAPPAAGDAAAQTPASADQPTGHASGAATASTALRGARTHGPARTSAGAPGQPPTGRPGAARSRAALRLLLRAKPFGRSARVAAARSTLEVSGRLTTSASGRVQLRLERLVGGRWVKVGGAVAGVRGGSFRRTFARLAAGRYRVAAAALTRRGTTGSAASARIALG
jgi:hypothetical protein